MKAGVVRSALAFFLAAVLFAILPAGSLSADPLPPAIRDLDGHWKGDGLDLTFDIRRSQARVDPQKPFAWKSLVVTNITDDMVVFFIGPMRFVGTVGNDGRLTLTGTAFAGSRTLIKVPGNERPGSQHPGGRSADPAPR
ncbi:hypothetical protein SAMN05216548_10492 [Faunimonas pinastri]|uniref:Uncharacterized protein n=2 Tax=Faunimonas pinastri TaxID=1855383 RepID=A0A1H9FEA6_9HYPH|nr:hypothetical protein SAMN05216548_10492 [Faunimonas pinastri]